LSSKASDGIATRAPVLTRRLHRRERARTVGGKRRPSSGDADHLAWIVGIHCDGRLAADLTPRRDRDDVRARRAWESCLNAGRDSRDADERNRRRGSCDVPAHRPS